MRAHHWTCSKVYRMGGKLICAPSNRPGGVKDPAESYFERSAASFTIFLSYADNGKRGHRMEIILAIDFVIFIKCYSDVGSELGPDSCGLLWPVRLAQRQNEAARTHLFLGLGP